MPLIFKLGDFHLILLELISVYMLYAVFSHCSLVVFPFTFLHLPIYSLPKLLHYFAVLALYYFMVG